jgi:uncharacterized protein YcfJ
MKNKAVLLAIVGACALSAPPAHAVGCLTGAVAGGIAGHYAGHHAVLGAIGGCIAGHHLKKEQERQAIKPATPPPATPAPSTPTPQ